MCKTCHLVPFNGALMTPVLPVCCFTRNQVAQSSKILQQIILTDMLAVPSIVNIVAASSFPTAARHGVSQRPTARVSPSQTSDETVLLPQIVQHTVRSRRGSENPAREPTEKKMAFDWWMAPYRWLVFVHKNKIPNTFSVSNCSAVIMKQTSNPFKNKKTTIYNATNYTSSSSKASGAAGTSFKRLLGRQQIGLLDERVSHEIIKQEPNI